jgi:hypothetical protein
MTRKPLLQLGLRCDDNSDFYKFVNLFFPIFGKKFINDNFYDKLQHMLFRMVRAAHHRSAFHKPKSEIEAIVLPMFEFIRMHKTGNRQMHFGRL